MGKTGLLAWCLGLTNSVDPSSAQEMIKCTLGRRGVAEGAVGMHRLRGSNSQPQPRSWYHRRAGTSGARQALSSVQVSGLAKPQDNPPPAKQHASERPLSLCSPARAELAGLAARAMHSWQCRATKCPAVPLDGPGVYCASHSRSPDPAPEQGGPAFLTSSWTTLS
jgi:hypothetical protein